MTKQKIKKQKKSKQNKHSHHVGNKVSAKLTGMNQRRQVHFTANSIVVCR